jgi:hypothetical protein
MPGAVRYFFTLMSFYCGLMSEKAVFKCIPDKVKHSILQRFCIRGRL